ncbi:hypothetical protein [Dactylosporangium sp. CA-233914]|uniref:hypothetical protein n=1 Tax=Dactylosporangium sp. CA-233914 TaxID=3239934 RepID=UPI003D9015E0
MHRPRTVATKSAVILGLYVLAALGAVALQFVRLPANVPMVLVVLLLVAAFVVGQQLVWSNGWGQIATFLAAGVFVTCTAMATHSLTLSWHGDEVDAIVTDVNHGRNGNHYTLEDSRHRSIAGQVTTFDDDYRVGDVVTVVVDRSDWVNPQTPYDVSTGRPVAIVALVGFVLTAAITIPGARTRGSGRPPRKGPFGIWIFERS